MLDTAGYLEGTIKLRTADDALTYFSRWGRPVSTTRHPELIREISPQPSNTAPSNTLSSRYGFGSFPFHTDGAHWPRPPRYLILYCQHPGRGQRETLLCNPLPSLRVDEQNILRHELWRISGVRKSFSARVLDGTCGQEFLRFDHACMNPMGDSGKSTELLSLCLVRQPATRVAWEADKFLIIDNWKMLHSRGPPVISDPDRLHWRILLE